MTATRPGLLILVVGPSGAGKDTLIDRARVALAGDQVVFTRRIVTRPPSEAEQHDSLDDDAFSAALASGAFAFDWRAHGLRYAIPVAIEASLEAGATVVCNVSRGIVEALRRRYGRVRIVFVDAPLEVRLSRIAGRARQSEQADRGLREQALSHAQADRLVWNDGDIETALAAFLEAIMADGPGPSGSIAP